MRFKLEFDTDNDDFFEAPHSAVSGILRIVAQKIVFGLRNGPVYDNNGNTIGRWELDHEDAYNE
jgi:hypothetical protein